MLHGPWKEAGAPTVVLHIDDLNVNSEAIAMALAYLYGFHPQLNDKNAFRVLAAASFLDLQVIQIINLARNRLSYMLYLLLHKYWDFLAGLMRNLHGFYHFRTACFELLFLSGMIYFLVSS